MKLRLGLVGLGPNWGPRRRPALRSLADRFEVRAVCDPVAHRAEQAASELGCRAVDGFRAIAASEDIDALVLLSARWYGTLPLSAACDYSKAIYCGASVDLAAEQARRLRDRVQEAGIAFMAEFPNRLAPATIRLKELIATRLGPPRLLFCNQRLTSPSAKEQTAFGVTPRSVNMRHLVEMVDWCRYVVGSEVLAVHAASHTAPGGDDHGPVDDYTLMSLEFEPPASSGGLSLSRPMAQIACGSYVPPAWSEATAFRRPADLQVICERGIGFIDLPNTLVWFDDAGQHTESLEPDRPIDELLLMQFLRTVESLVIKRANLDDAFRALSLVIDARHSHAQGRRIECPADSFRS